MAFEIKDEFKDTVVGFNNSGLPLGKRHDLHLLAEAALKADGSVKDPYIASMFKTLPTREEIKAAKEKGFVQKQANKPAVQNPDNAGK